MISPALTRRLLEQASLKAPIPKGEAEKLGLTKREIEVLQAVAGGLTNQEIARKLHISLGTTKAHLSTIMTKLEARNRVELALWAYQHGLPPDGR